MIKGPVIECENCNKQYEIGIDEFKKDEYHSEEERDMGFAINYVWLYENICKFCNNPIIVEIGGSSYPIGDPIEYDECSFGGCKIIKEAEME